MFFILFLLLLSSTAYSSSFLNTLSINGEVSFDAANINASLYYTLRNDTAYPLDEWTFLIHPSVDILSASQGGNQIKTEMEHGFNYKIVSVKLPEKLKSGSRSAVNIKFTVSGDSPRLTVSSNFVFLDSREFWFPYPVRDYESDFKITVKTPERFNSVMGGRLTYESLSAGRKLKTWENEIKTIAPGMSLVILESPAVSNAGIFVYDGSEDFQNAIHEGFLPFWESAKHNYKFFPFSQIHIVPMDIYMPRHHGKHIEGEFLGNMFLVSKSMIENLQKPHKGWDSPAESLIETLIHEFHHGFFPGMVSHKKEELMFTESLVQYLSWMLIESVSPDWSKKIALRTRFYLQNMLLRGSGEIEFLKDIIMLRNASKYAGMSGFELADALIEKYRYIGYSKDDVLETIYQHQQHKKHLNPLAAYDGSYFEHLNDPVLYNSSIKAVQTNFNITVTNEDFFKKNQIVELPVEAVFVSIEHDYPYTWQGEVHWAGDESADSIVLSLKKNDIWETNFTGGLEHIRIKSFLETSEKQLLDNSISYGDAGQLIIDRLNKGEFEGLSEVLDSIYDNGLTLLWDSTSEINGETYAGAFVMAGGNPVYYITVQIGDPLLIISE